MSETIGDGDLGKCCCCGTEEGVRNVLTLEFRAPVPGTGWGCFVCNLPPDGALAVVCDGCLREGSEIVLVCYGYPLTKERTPIGDVLDNPFSHRAVLHEAHDSGWSQRPEFSSS